ncbi:MAG TPA: bifunctional phosphoribosylaminoimidazolecarboxamide formyltransferase/IMP cyclohydrolase, partial [Thermomicrobiaceae bacterium]|nr:bifunctional phosphoribosylaminoimidazolecarboxamide formyltransferase/IMP cyclohydrolase [Thermomicrobiaceae bacterium]
MRALLSVYDKSGLIELAEKLLRAGFELISTGNTMRVLTESGLQVRAVSDVTGSPEMLEGRVKTLHPAIHGGLLARRDLPEHMAELERYGIEPIDLVVSNLYPFAEVTRQAAVSLEDALENIDIGGPTLIRAAAKNFPAVLIVVDPVDYGWIGDQLVAGGLEAVDQSERRKLAAKAFAHVASYDSVIAQYLRPAKELPEQLSIAGTRVRELRYGENPHQAAAL